DHDGESAAGNDAERCRSERDAEAAPGLPHHQALPAGRSVHQLEPLGKLDAAAHFETGAAGGDVEDAAIDGGHLGVDNDLAHPRGQARRPNADKSAVLAHFPTCSGADTAAPPT